MKSRSVNKRYAAVFIAIYGHVVSTSRSLITLGGLKISNSDFGVNTHTHTEALSASQLKKNYEFILRASWENLAALMPLL